MSLQYLSDEKGQIVAVQVPIKEWELLVNKYPELDIATSATLPDWQIELIDRRLKSIEENPNSIHSIESFMEELDREIN